MSQPKYITEDRLRILIESGITLTGKNFKDAEVVGGKLRLRNDTKTKALHKLVKLNRERAKLIQTILK